MSSIRRQQTVPEPRCCRSKCSVDKRALRATDDQCSSVGRTQSSDTGVGDELAVVSQVAWDVAGQRPMNQRGDLVVDVPTTDTYVLVNIKYTLLRCLVHGRK